LVYFGLDDWFQIHEAISNYSFALTGIGSKFNWVYIYFPIFILGIVTFNKMYHRIKPKPSIIIGLILLFMAYCLEFVEMINLESKFIFYQQTLEEALEMLGITAITVSVFAKLKNTTRGCIL